MGDGEASFILFLRAKEIFLEGIFHLTLSVISLTVWLFWRCAALHPQGLPKEDSAWSIHESICSSIREPWKQTLCGWDARHCSLLGGGGRHSTSPGETSPEMWPLLGGQWSLSYFPPEKLTTWTRQLKPELWFLIQAQKLKVTEKVK